MSERHVTVRLARPDEYARIGELTVEVYTRGGLIPPGSAYLHTLADAADRAAKAELLVAEVDGEIAGAVAYAPPDSPYAELAAPDEGEFRMLVVQESSRGNGVGRALVQECADRARRAGLVALRLSTQPNMRVAQRLYERMGFTRTPELDWSPVEGVNLLTYVLDLRPAGDGVRPS
ncbi:N-acetyltransferase [Actinomadura sp. NBRC 104412]|uniref:GNAT family N-acetyltransferase n=1 Tax=Actinomadura sp. NBRC 104412 TaxID=3032203 RepID=UPI0024A2D75C|nr:GNAT family N-acetyltransferase [Actinomadura sp. NBRC 104412]GLZ05472.1 N-acetyltransferase [Actinomadura sp. NBRC 104412]